MRFSAPELFAPAILCSEKVPEFISLAARMFSCVIYALIIGWKLSLVFLSVSPVIVLTFNVTIKVSEQQKYSSDTHTQKE